MALGESTTWTLGRILGRLQQTGDEVVVFAGHHEHQGVIRGIGDHLLTLAAGEDVLAIDLTAITGVRVLGQVLQLEAGEH